MSDEETQVLQASYRDGQLQIVEVNPYEPEAKPQGPSMPELASGSNSLNEPKYVLDTGSGFAVEKGLVQLDLLNLTVVRCKDSYQLVSNSEGDKHGAQVDEGITCVLQQNSDGEEVGNHDTYVMLENDQCPVVYLQPSAPPAVSLPEPEQEQKEPKDLTPEEIIEKAKEVVKTLTPRAGGARGRKRAGELPPPHEMLASPNFKLYLYSCKLCTFKCNAIKELTAHKSSEHGGGRYRCGAGAGGKAGPALQCARCPFRAQQHQQLMKHVQEKHMVESPETETETVNLDSAEAAAADVLVCGACGFESASRVQFKRHIEKHIEKRTS